MKVLYFGSYDPTYSRNRIIKKGLIANKIKVLENRASGLLPLRYFKLISQFLKHQKKLNAIIVGFPGHYDMPLAFLLGKIFKKKVFFDIFTSTHETYVVDRAVIKKGSIRAFFYFALDWIGLKLADYVLVDTKTHGEYYSKTFGLKNNKQILVYVGSDDDFFYPRKVKKKTDVIFYGSYQPLHGTDTIIKAASLLPKINFKMIGEGKKKKEAQNLAKKLSLKNVKFVGWLPLEKLAIEINKAEIGLGIFGSSEKANSVIPNKIYDYIACRVPVITSNSNAISEIFKENNDIILVPQQNSKALANRIKNLTEKESKKKEIIENSEALYKKNFKPRITVYAFCIKLEHVASRKIS